MTNSEEHINEINTNIFFKEFTFGLDNIIITENNQQVELADNIVCFEDYFIIYQIKERNLIEKSVSYEKWFNNKVLNKAVKQIKSTVKILNSEDEIIIKNNRQHIRQLNKLPLENLRKVIIYDPKEEILEEVRFKKFYESDIVQLIHLFHIEDYHWICKYLVTPYEVYDYLTFREAFYEHKHVHLNVLPEQYLLGHFLSGADYDHFNPGYIENLTNLNNDVDSFDLGFYLSKFGDKVKFTTNENDYYYILAEIAKLHRNELKEFKKRFLKIFELCKETDLYVPYRITISTGCGFVFVPLPKSESINWKEYLLEAVLSHKYEQKINKCVGVVVYEDSDYFEVFWSYVESDWEYNEIFEKLKNEMPLRKLSKKGFLGYDLNNTENIN